MIYGCAKGMFVDKYRFLTLRVYCTPESGYISFYRSALKWVIMERFNCLFRKSDTRCFSEELDRGLSSLFQAYWNLNVFIQFVNKEYFRKQSRLILTNLNFRLVSTILADNCQTLLDSQFFEIIVIFQE